MITLHLSLYILLIKCVFKWTCMNIIDVWARKLFESLLKSRYISTSFTHMTQFGLLLKNSRSEWRIRGVEGSRSWFLEEPRSSKSAEPPPPPPSLLPAVPFLPRPPPISSRPPTQAGRLELPHRRHGVSASDSSINARADFCFPALHYSADTVPHFVSTVKPLGAISLHPPVRSQTAQCTAVIDASIFGGPSFCN